MQYTIITVLATVASLASAQSSAAPSMSPIGAVVPVGENCTPGGTMCALGSQCYATNSMLQPRCGNFQASCTSNQQCAFNTCNIAPGGKDGLCNGFIPSSSSSARISSTPTGSSSAPTPTITAPVGSIGLGKQCNAFAGYNQCANGANCYASNSGLITLCGNFNSACSSDSQCAFNKCNITPGSTTGLCNGALLSSSAASNMTMTASSMKPSGMTGSATATGGNSATKTNSMPVFTGAAASFVPEVMAVVLGVAAWAL